jgi:hypothetical protein
MENKIYLFAFALILVAALASANLGTFKQFDCVNIKTILNTSAVNISTINYPNSTLAATNQEMTKISYTFNYSFCGTSDLGTYTYDYFDADGNVYVNDFTITPNGKDAPSGGIVVLFSAIFIVLIGLSCYFVVYTLGHFMQLDFDVIDLAIDFGIFFMVIVSFYFEGYYLANPFIGSMQDIMFYISGILFVLVPVIAFIVSLIVGGLNPNSKMKISTPKKMRWNV